MEFEVLFQAARIPSLEGGAHLLMGAGVVLVKRLIFLS
jgi:hypothetical protein